MKIKKAFQEVPTPTYATPGSACFDLASIETATICCRGTEIIRTGLHVEVPPGHVMLIFSRSGHGFKHGVRLANAVGVVDSDYRGEIMVALHNDSLNEFRVMQGDRIAQALVIPVVQQTFEIATHLSETDRGVNGFGSTGLG